MTNRLVTALADLVGLAMILACAAFPNAAWPARLFGGGGER
jgi:hypothetical protein